jgi:cardiolipin synthase A/B
MRLRPIVKYGSVVAAVALAVLLVANLALGDKRIDQKIEHEYPVSSPQFERVVSVAFGPALIRGNRTRALVNGGRIFPAML